MRPTPFQFEEFEKFGIVNKKLFGFGASASWESWQCVRVITGYLKQYIKGKERILDAGCGTGICAREILSNFENAEVIGIDISKDNTEIANQVCPEATFLVRDTQNTGFPDKSFDKVIMDEVLEQVDLPQDALKEIARILKDNGLLLLIVPLCPPWPFIRKISAKIRPLINFSDKTLAREEEHHLRLYNIKTLIKEVEPYFSLESLKKYNLLTIFFPLWLKSCLQAKGSCSGNRLY